MDIKEISLDFGLDSWGLGGLWLVYLIRSLQIPLKIRNSSTNSVSVISSRKTLPIDSFMLFHCWCV